MGRVSGSFGRLGAFLAELRRGGGVMETSFKQLCLGWTLAFVLVVGSILILAQWRAGDP